MIPGPRQRDGGMSKRKNKAGQWNTPSSLKKRSEYCERYDMSDCEALAFRGWLEEGHSIRSHYKPRFLPDTEKLTFIEGYRLDLWVKRWLRKMSWDEQELFLLDYVKVDDEELFRELMEALNPR